MIDLAKKGVCPKENPEKYDDAYNEYKLKFDNKVNKMELKLQMELVKIDSKSKSEVDADRASEIKKELDELLTVKGRMKSIAKEMKNNVVDAVKKAGKAAKSKADELKEKIQNAKEDKAE